MIFVLLFAGISIGLVWLVTADCRAHRATSDTEELPRTRVPRD